MIHTIPTALLAALLLAAPAAADTAAVAPPAAAPAPGTVEAALSAGTAEAPLPAGTAEAAFAPGTGETRLPPPGAAGGIPKPEDLLKGTTQEVAFALNWNIAHPGVEAIEWFAKLVELHPDRAEYHGRLAMANLQAARHDEALEAGARALALDPKEPWALTACAMIRQERSEDTEAVELLKRLLASDVDAVWRELCLVTREFLNARLAASLGVLGRVEEAEAAIRESLKTKTDSDDPWFATKLVERFYLAAGRIDDAKRIYEEILGKDPKELNALVQLAALLIHNGETDRALPLLATAVEVGGEFLKPHFYLFRAHFRKGNLKEAKKALEKCASFEYRPQKQLELDSQRVCLLPSPSELLSITHLALGDWDKFVDLEVMHHSQDRAASLTPFVVEDFFTDVEGHAEYSLEEALRFYHRTHEKEKIANPWLPLLEKALLPADKEARRAFDKAAAHLAVEEYAKAFEQAKLGLKRDRSCPGLHLQAAVAARFLDYPEFALETAATLAAQPPAATDPVTLLARDFALVGILEPFTVNRVNAAGEKKFLRTVATRGLDEAKIAFLGATYEAVEAEVTSLFDASDSVTERAFASLVLTNVYANLAHVVEAGRWYSNCYKRDPEFKIIRWLFPRFGRYYGL